MAIRLLGFMPDNTSLVKVRRGSVEWDAGLIVKGRHCSPVGLSYLVDGE
jgi:hypothetical protein